jgi:outer membrane lipoprotein-sorting protein
MVKQIKIEDKLRGSQTMLEFKEIKLDQGLDDTIFSQRFLKRRVG